jgi:hypothetical protein
MSPATAAPAVTAAVRGQAVPAQRGGSLAGSVSAGVLAALRRSVNTLSVLLPIFKIKKCVDRSSTQ